MMGGHVGKACVERFASASVGGRVSTRARHLVPRAERLQRNCPPVQTHFAALWGNVLDYSSELDQLSIQRLDGPFKIRINRRQLLFVLENGLVDLNDSLGKVVFGTVRRIDSVGNLLCQLGFEVRFTGGGGGEVTFEHRHTVLASI